MAVASRSSSGHTRSASKMRRLPLDSAVVRSSKLGCPNVPNGLRFDQDDVEGELGQRQRERRADEAAAADSDVTAHDIRAHDFELRSAGSIHQLLDGIRFFRQRRR